jgi:integrase
MELKEYRVIMETIRQKAREAGKRASAINSRQSASQLFPIGHFVAEYGLRIGDVLTLRLEKGERFSVRTKGGQVRGFELRPETRKCLEQYGYLEREPFRRVGLSTVQGANRKLTGRLAEQGKIRHRYSAHDYRHYYAVKLYQETQDAYAVKEALGHSTTTVAEVYLAGLGASEK